MCCGCNMSDHTVPQALDNEANTEQPQALIKIICM